MPPPEAHSKVRLLRPPLHVSEIDPDQIPAALWTREFITRCQATVGSSPLTLTLVRADGTSATFRTLVLPLGVNDFENFLLVERTFKFLLWSRGGNEIKLAGTLADYFVGKLRETYQPGGTRSFDCEFHEKIFETPIVIGAVDESKLPTPLTSALTLGRHLEGCRIGFDLGGSDRKCAALIEGKVVFSEEVKWDPYFQADPNYHLAGIRDSLNRAAAHLPRVDAIGGSAAGVYLHNKVCIASLFRGVTNSKVFSEKVSGIFLDLAKEWKVPFEVLNDGDVTALAASMSLGRNAVLGVAMGTSVAAGYVDSEGKLTHWLSELAFVPVDYRDGGPLDEWSGDQGCAVQYFSQQAVGRLLPLAGIHLPATLPLPEKLEALQRLMAQGDPRAHKVYKTIGIALGYAVAHFASFYPISALLIMGRVTTGAGGDLIIARAMMVLRDEFPELRIDLITPNEKDKRHGQAIAAASLPPLS